MEKNRRFIPIQTVFRQVISQDYYNLTVAEYLKQGYNECDAQIKALEVIKDKFNIRFKEVIDKASLCTT